jgi:hypothetical protein
LNDFERQGEAAGFEPLNAEAKPKVPYLPNINGIFFSRKSIPLMQTKLNISVYFVYEK